MLACLRLRAHQCDLPCSCPCVPVAAPGALPDMSPMERAFIAKSEVFDVPMELELRQVALSLSLPLSLTRSIARSLARPARALSLPLSLSRCPLSLSLSLHHFTRGAPLCTQSVCILTCVQALMPCDAASCVQHVRQCAWSCVSLSITNPALALDRFVLHVCLPCTFWPILPLQASTTA